jgi:hypothetical protein
MIILRELLIAECCSMRLIDMKDDRSIIDTRVRTVDRRLQCPKDSDNEHRCDCQYLALKWLHFGVLSRFRFSCTVSASSRSENVNDSHERLQRFVRKSSKCGKGLRVGDSAER